MGVSQSHSRSPSREPLPNDHQVMDVLEPTDKSSKRGRKRKVANVNGVEMKKVAKLNTCAYVYQKLFLEGEDSDITIAACGREWKVHKLYLKQTKFFESMFDGAWAESKTGRVDMEITDPNIDGDGLNAVLGCLYHNEIEIDLENIEATVAAASYIVLESVTERCAEMMIEALSTSNAVRYYELSTKYGLDGVRVKSLELLLHQFFKIMTDKEMLRELDHDLLVTLLTSPNLFIMEGEYDLYKTVRLWIYMKECPDCDIDQKPDTFSQNVSRYFRDAPQNSLFLKYSEIFSFLRIEQFLNCSETIKAIKADCLIPSSLITLMTSDLWMSLLENEETQKALEIDDDEFFSRCIRLGRSLDVFPKCWRWVGYNFGIDLLLHVNDYSVSIKRNCLNQKAPYSVNLKTKQVLHYRLVICESSGRICFDSGRTTWEMKPDEAKTVCRMNEDISTPISVHFQYLIHKPIDGTRYVNNFVDDHYSSDGDENEENDDDED
ncbi:CRE-GCL-1 protein [Caenorhabditis remanei]|uniref:CRE-GCL-1 protein n=1 Tax=Caenorhabditis remanei TaxID=31234 RepID=E3M676_CAERE|nr:CRE-GCL-1 protein [Caenorhabditis remanei]